MATGVFLRMRRNGVIKLQIFVPDTDPNYIATGKSGLVALAYTIGAPGYYWGIRYFENGAGTESGSPIFADEFERSDGPLGTDWVESWEGTTMAFNIVTEILMAQPGEGAGADEFGVVVPVLSTDIADQYVKISLYNYNYINAGLSVRGLGNADVWKGYVGTFYNDGAVTHTRFNIFYVDRSTDTFTLLATLNVGGGTVTWDNIILEAIEGEIPDEVVVITTTCPLPPATKGVPYELQFEATGGTEPYTWSRTHGPMPTGLTLSSGGLLSGTPTRTGFFSITVKAESA